MERTHNVDYDIPPSPNESPGSDYHQPGGPQPLAHEDPRLNLAPGNLTTIPEENMAHSLSDSDSEQMLSTPGPFPEFRPFVPQLNIPFPHPFSQQGQSSSNILPNQNNFRNVGVPFRAPGSLHSISYASDMPFSAQSHFMASENTISPTTNFGQNEPRNVTLPYYGGNTFPNVNARRVTHHDMFSSPSANSRAPGPYTPQSGDYQGNTREYLQPAQQNVGAYGPSPIEPSNYNFGGQDISNQGVTRPSFSGFSETSSCTNSPSSFSDCVRRWNMRRFGTPTPFRSPAVRPEFQVHSGRSAYNPFLPTDTSRQWIAPEYGYTTEQHHTSPLTTNSSNFSNQSSYEHSHYQSTHVQSPFLASSTRTVNPPTESMTEFEQAHGDFRAQAPSVYEGSAEDGNVDPSGHSMHESSVYHSNYPFHGDNQGAERVAQPTPVSHFRWPSGFVPRRPSSFGHEGNVGAGMMSPGVSSAFGTHAHSSYSSLSYQTPSEGSMTQPLQTLSQQGRQRFDPRLAAAFVNESTAEATVSDPSTRLSQSPFTRTSSNTNPAPIASTSRESDVEEIIQDTDVQQMQTSANRRQQLQSISSTTAESHDESNVTVVTPVTPASSSRPKIRSGAQRGRPRGTQSQTSSVKPKTASSASQSNRRTGSQRGRSVSTHSASTRGRGVRSLSSSSTPRLLQRSQSLGRSTSNVSVRSTKKDNSKSHATSRLDSSGNVQGHPRKFAKTSRGVNEDLKTPKGLPHVMQITQMYKNAQVSSSSSNLSDDQVHGGSGANLMQSPNSQSQFNISEPSTSFHANYAPSRAPESALHSVSRPSAQSLHSSIDVDRLDPRKVVSGIRYTLDPRLRSQTPSIVHVDLEEDTVSTLAPNEMQFLRNETDPQNDSPATATESNETSTPHPTQTPDKSEASPKPGLNAAENTTQISALDAIGEITSLQESMAGQANAGSSGQDEEFQEQRSEPKGKKNENEIVTSEEQLAAKESYLEQTFIDDVLDLLTLSLDSSTAEKDEAQNAASRNPDFTVQSDDSSSVEQDIANDAETGNNDLSAQLCGSHNEDTPEEETKVPLKRKLEKPKQSKLPQKKASQKKSPLKKKSHSSK